MRQRDNIMTRQREDELVRQLQEIEARKRDAILAVVEASLSGSDPHTAIVDLQELSRSKIALTNPSLSAAAF